ncbi:type VI secretion protein IcmF/TssM N-terminal domain-containing protein [Desulfosarcina sp.]|uniref:type VI secretion protein IcmF/TssM N-terminal domain-containing protein n=1 Tax=Desulfosarcina sp. TaxID=2027861 RepID=UPI00299FF51C|nr:type VI secretion protein IcmF/TssM N-terminal domain-containing protein [Desulfosarcina sp.]MDX2454684.1 type VI secretion protein IcmF/TssM N-terminal domain-containing protein [Desulfosarcina sp.]MDX2492304.1 type VI secretion protein IcmF/TssM N-terminal domain-containing protein [Desulfosarcina sp.]
MKSLIMKTLKVILLLFLAALALLLIFGLALMAGWPWWVGFFFLIGILGIFLFVIFIKKLLARKSEKNFIHQVIAEDESRIKSMDKGKQAGYTELQARWKEAIGALRKSHLKKYGNPLYVLPWYMVIGESGSGKTTAIQGADLSSPFAEVSRVSGISGTRNCDWWFFEQAVLIDTAGRYAIPVDEGRDKDEWQKFLSLLVRFRKKEPLNGLVVTVAADQLLQEGVSSLENAGKSIRRRIDELMRVLGAKFPVFIMVTKCDLIQGAVRFCDRLEEPSLHQAMGRLNTNLIVDMAAFCKESVDDIGERLKELRLLMLNQNRAKGKTADPSLLLFPQEFEKIESGLAAFMRGAFQENPYQETPILRGIYFSSGRQEGTPYSHFLSQLGLIGEKEVLPGTNRGLFLHDFFSTILPNDRKLFAPTQKTLEWSRLTRSLGLTAWVAIVIAACGLLSFSFVKNLKTLRDVSQSFSTAPILQGDITTDTLIMERFKQAVVKIESQNANWWIPRLGLYESDRVEAGLKQKYCQVLESGFLNNFDKQMSDRMTRFSAATPPEVMGSHAMHLVRRINLLKARLQGRDREALTALPVVAYSGDLMATAVIDEITDQIGGHYLYYLTWRREDRLLNDELNDLQTWLKHILTLQGASLNWLVDWVNRNGNLAGVRMEDFWKGLSPDPEAAVVPAGYTPEGRDAINGTLAEIESALFEPLSIGSQKLDFQKWYANAYIDQWEAFARYFAQGPDRLAGRDLWQQTGMNLATDQGPYFQLLARMAESLAPVKDQEKVPEWVDLIYRMRDTRIQAKTLDAQGVAKAGIIKRTTDKVASRLNRLESRTGVETTDALSFEARMDSAKAYKQYQDALQALSAVADSRKTAFKAASGLYSEDPATGESPFFMARQGEKKLRMVLGKKNKQTDLFWDLINGPIQFYHAYVIREAQCQLQSIWEKEVFLEVQYVSSGMDLNKLLMGNDGYAIKFVKGPAAPFIDRSRGKGYHARSIEGRSLDFRTDFLTFLTRGERVAKPVVANYRVSIKAYPTDANSEALVKPHATKLELQCGNDRNQLINLHYPVRKTFNWSAQSCGDVVFKIEIGNLVLTTVYDGYLGFPRFLNDFKTGQRTFRPGDFPEQATALKRMRIRKITAKYQLSGHKPVLRFLQASPGRVPQEITSCWEN